MDIVTEVLEKTSRNSENFKSITVEKHLDLEFDLGTLLAIDKNDLDAKALKDRPDEYIEDLTRDNTQLLFNKIWELPTEKLEGVIVAKLPESTFVLPRARPIPKPKILTKWQRFAQEKGIVKTKKPKLTWDDTLRKWVPRFGFKKAAAEKDKQWLIEIPQNADPMEDQFEKSTNAKSERIAKNELQRLRNIARAKNVKVPRMGIMQVDKTSARDLSTAATVAKGSTASLGKFQPKLPKEKEARGVSAIVPGRSRKRKLPPVSASVEKKQHLEVVNSILNKQPKIDIDKAVAKRVNEEKIQQEEERRSKKAKAGRSGKKNGKGRGNKKPSGGKGERNPKKRNIGRKRR